MAFAIHNENHADRHEGGRDDEDQDPAAKGLNHASAGGRRLGIAEGTALGKSLGRSGEHNYSDESNSYQ